MAHAVRAVCVGQTYFQAGLLNPWRNGLEPGEGPTARELEVLRLVAQGYRNHQIAESLSMSERTVHAHLRNLFGKLQVSSRSEMTYRARAEGWIT